MNNASEALLALKPVTFRYTKEVDPGCTAQFGLVAEEVKKLDPALIVRDKEGKPYSVRYDQVNAMSGGALKLSKFATRRIRGGSAPEVAVNNP